MFTYAEMKQLHAEHGNALTWWTDDGEGPFSANPADYWMHVDADEFAGELRVLVPECFATVAAHA